MKYRFFKIVILLASVPAFQGSNVVLARAETAPLLAYQPTLLNFHTITVIWKSLPRPRLEF